MAGAGRRLPHPCVLRKGGKPVSVAVSAAVICIITLSRYRRVPLQAPQCREPVPPHSGSAAPPAPNDDQKARVTFSLPTLAKNARVGQPQWGDAKGWANPPWAAFSRRVAANPVPVVGVMAMLRQPSKNLFRLCGIDWLGGGQSSWPREAENV